MSIRDFKGEAYAYDRLFRESDDTIKAAAHEHAMLATWHNLIRIAFAGIVLALIAALMRMR